MKSEPDVFSIDDLAKCGRSLWDGVRNYQARNFMTQSMRPGHRVLFYHSNAKPPGIVGLARISAGARPDPTQFDKTSPYFEPRAKFDRPIWFGVEVEFERKLSRPISLDELRKTPGLEELLILKPGQRLSITPVASREFEIILQIAGSP